MPRKRHQIQIDRVQDQLNGHQNDDDIAPRKHTDHARHKQRRRNNQIVNVVMGTITSLISCWL